MRGKTIRFLLQQRGIRGLGECMRSGLGGGNRYQRWASAIDFRNAPALDLAATPGELLVALLPHRTAAEVDEALRQARLLLASLPEDESGQFPQRWNAGSALKLLVATLILLERPDCFVETGTANGASAGAGALAMEYVGHGRYFTYDYEECVAALIPGRARNRVSLQRLERGTALTAQRLIADVGSGNKVFFLHDADHSYRGQTLDYQAARDSGCQIVISDDVDTSLAFVDFATGGQILWDLPKFIGACRLS